MIYWLWLWEAASSGASGISQLHYSPFTLSKGLVQVLYQPLTLTMNEMLLAVKRLVSINQSINQRLNLTSN